MINLDKVTLGAAAGTVTNMVVGGIGARLAMRVVVLLIGGQPAASVDGVTGILLVAAMMEVVSGILWLANSQELRVAAIGCLLLAAGSFHVIGPLESLMARGAAASVLESLLAVAGAAVAALQPRRVYACFQGQA